MLHTKSIITFGALAVSSLGGYYWFEQKSTEELRISECYEQQRIASTELNEIDDELMELNQFFQNFDLQSKNHQDKINQYKQQINHQESQITLLVSQIQSAEYARDRTAKVWCSSDIFGCETDKTNAINKFNQAIQNYNMTIAQYNETINNIIDINILEEESKLSTLSEEKAEKTQKQKDLKNQKESLDQILSTKCVPKEV
jgi:peptidoglycan hydrolase CwlO-like protein